MHNGIETDYAAYSLPTTKHGYHLFHDAEDHLFQVRWYKTREHFDKEMRTDINMEATAWPCFVHVRAWRNKI